MLPSLFPQNDYWTMFAGELSGKITNELCSIQADEYSLTPQKTRILPKSPKEGLIAILRQKKQIKDWFSNCINNSIQFINAADENNVSFP